MKLDDVVSGFEGSGIQLKVIFVCQQTFRSDKGVMSNCIVRTKF